MKNLVLGLAKGYNWYILEPFIRSFVKNFSNADMVLFMDDYSEFTAYQLEQVIREFQGGKIIIEPVPEVLKVRFPANSRWKVFADYLEMYGENYEQIFLSDTRDVIFQSDVFKCFENKKKYVGYAEDFGDIGGKVCGGLQEWVEMAYGEEEFHKLADKVSVCPGTVIGTSNEVKILIQKMWEYMPPDKDFYGLDQVLYAYIIYNKLVPVENEIFINCYDGAILSSEWFHFLHPIEFDGDFLLRGDGKIPAAVHQYDRWEKVVELVDRIYRVPVSQPNKRFLDIQSKADQFFHLVQSDDLKYAYEFFKDCSSDKSIFSRKGNDLIGIWKSLVNRKNFDSYSEPLEIAIQKSIISAFENGFYINHGKTLCKIMADCKKNNRPIIEEMPYFVKRNSLNAVKFHLEKNNRNRYMRCLDLLARANLADHEYFYALQAEICLMLNRRDLASTAYREVIARRGYSENDESALVDFKTRLRENLPEGYEY